MLQTADLRSRLKAYISVRIDLVAAAAGCMRLMRLRFVTVRPGRGAEDAVRARGSTGRRMEGRAGQWKEVKSFSGLYLRSGVRAPVVRPLRRSCAKDAAWRSSGQSA